MAVDGGMLYKESIEYRQAGGTVSGAGQNPEVQAYAEGTNYLGGATGPITWVLESVDTAFGQTTELFSGTAPDSDRTAYLTIVSYPDPSSTNGEFRAATLSFGSNQAAGPTPPPGPQLVHWFNPGVGVTIDSGISAVQNQVMGGPDAVQANPSLQPQQQDYSSDGFQTQYPAFLFDGGSTRLEFVIPNTLNDFSIVTNIWANAVNNGRAIAGSRGPTPLGAFLEFGTTNGRVHALLSNGGNSAQNSGILSTDPGDGTSPGYGVMMSYDSNLGNLNVQVFGAGISTVANIKLSAGDTFYIGGAPGRQSFDGYMSDVQVYDKALTFQEFQDARAALMAKYGGA